MTSKPTIRERRDMSVCSHHQKKPTRCNALPAGIIMGSDEGLLNSAENLKNALAKPVFKNLSRRAPWL
ncbi:MAG: hypothetical protein P8Y91_06330 [Desulfuromonadales bacterium]|jgi:hypothetical protein